MCESCKLKKMLIDALKEQVSAQKELIELLIDKRSPSYNQKLNKKRPTHLRVVR